MRRSPFTWSSSGCSPPRARRKRASAATAYLARAWQWKEESGGTIVRQLRRLGASCDWSRERFTMDARALARGAGVVRPALGRRADLPRRPHRQLVPAVPDRPLRHRGRARGARRRVRLHQVRPGHPRARCRPETKLGDTGLAVHPKDKRYKHLVGKTLEMPSVDGTITVKVVADEAVDPKFGTGVIKVTPGHDPVDFEIGRRHNLPDQDRHRLRRANDGRRRPLRGDRPLRVPQADRRGHEGARPDREDRALPPRGRHLLSVARPSSSRSCRSSGACRSKPLAEAAIKAVRERRITIFPRSWTKTYYHWMENIQPWCISRQLWWGHRIPAWHCDADGSVHVSTRRPPGVPEVRWAAPAGPGHARHLVLVRPLAVLDPRMARRHDRPPNATIRPPCSSRGPTSSSSGSRGWRCSASTS